MGLLRTSLLALVVLPAVCLAQPPNPLFWNSTQGNLNSTGGSSSGGTTTPGGSTTQVQYNNGGSFGGISGSVVSGTGLTLAGNLSVTGTSIFNGTAVSTSAVISIKQSGTVSTSGFRLESVSGAGGSDIYLDSVSNLNILTQNSAIIFSTGSLEKARITASGISTSGVVATASVSFTALATGTATSNLCLNSGGGVISTSSLSGCLGVSDPKVKRDIRQLAYGLKEVMAMEPITYKDVRPGYYPGDQIGLLAYSVDRDGNRYRGLDYIVPELVDQHASQWNGQNLNGVIYERLAVVLVKAIQEQQSEIDELRAKAGLYPSPYSTFGSRLRWLATGH